MQRTSDAKQIFLDAVEQPAPLRTAFVNAACAGDAALRGRVLALLASHETRGGVLDHSLPLDGASLLEGLLAPAGAPPAPERIGEYRLVRVIGRGGFGEVWLAEQDGPLKRRVAVKLLHPWLAGRGGHGFTAAAEVVARFEQERQALAVMDHPHIARVFAAGAVPPGGPHAGLPYFAMEYVDGPSITRYCDDRRLPITARLELFVKVCAAVQHAHQKGVIHRDLKPANVLVSEVDGQPTPKVIDFGVAKAIGDRGAPGDDPAMTLQWQIIGTPQYMAPEQARGGGGGAVAAVDTRSDVYSLGAMLYELLCGATPVDADTLRRSAVDAMIKAVCETPPDPPSARLAGLPDAREAAARRATDPARLSAQLRGDLDWITLRALEKDPARRYQSASELAADVQRHLQFQPVTAGPPGRLYRAHKFVRRHRAGVLMSCLTATALVAATVVSIVQATRARRAEGLAVAQAEQARREMAKFESMARFSQGILRSIDPAVARGRDRTLMFEVLESTSRRAEKELAGQPEVAYPIHSMLGYAHGAIGEPGLAAAHYRKAMELSRQAYGPHHPDTLKEAGNYFGALTQSGQADEAETLARELSVAFDRAGRSTSADAMAFYSNLGAMQIGAGRLEEAKVSLERAAACIEAAGATRREALSVLNNLAAVLHELKDVGRAKEIWERLLAEQSNEFGDDHPGTMATVQNLASVALAQGDPAAAESLLVRAVAGKRRIYQPAHPSRLMSETDLGTFYVDRGRAADAVAVLRPAHADAVARLQPDDDRRAGVALALAEALRGAGRSGEAAPLADEAYACFSARPGSGGARAERALAVRLACAVDAGDSARAGELLSLAEATTQADSRPTDALTRAALALHAARAAALAGDTRNAHRLYAEARLAAGRLAPGHALRAEVERAATALGAPVGPGSTGD